jgi:hypothetical protein
MRDVVELLVADGFELFAARFEFLVDLDGFFGHRLVGFLRAADEREILAGGDSFVAVGIQSDAEQHGFAFFFRVRHRHSLNSASNPVKLFTKHQMFFLDKIIGSGSLMTFINLCAQFDFLP